MRWIVASSLRFRFVVVAAATALMFFGYQQLQNEKLDVFPEFAPTQVQIQTEALGLSASEVEQLVTVPLENSLAGVAHVDDIRSESVPQLSSIVLLFKSGTDLIQARQLVEERLQAAKQSLPTWAGQPQVLPPLSATSRIMAIGVSSRTLSPFDLSQVGYWTIRARLLRVPGVANVAIWGEKPKQLQARPDPHRMQARGVSMQQVMSATSTALDAGLLRFTSGSVVGTGGFVDTPSQRLSLQEALPVATPPQLADVPIENGVRIGDVANVTYGTQPLIGDAVVNGGPGLLIVVEKFPGANTLAVTHGVDTAIDALRPGLPGVKIDTHIFRPATFIETALHNVTVAVIIGCLLVVFVLIAFLFEWRAAFISLITIPLSIVAAAVVLDLRGSTINTLVLAGIAVAVGVVVDDAIIDTENIVRRLRLLRSEERRTPVISVILAASLEVRSAILYATLINVVAVVPVIFVGGLTGTFFQPLALSYALAVLASMVVALTVTPALSLILLGRAPLRREPALVRALKRFYGRLLQRVISTPWPAFAAVALAVIAAAAVLPRLGQDLFPTFREQDFLMHWITVPGTSLQETRRIVTRGSHEVKAIPGVRDFGSHIGQAFLGEEIAGTDFSENWVSVNPSADYNHTLASIRAVESQNPGIYRDVETYLRERIDEVLAGSSEAVVVRIFGQDLRTLRTEANRVTSALGSVRGLEDLHPEAQQDEPQIQVEVKLGVARRYGLKPGDVRRAEAALVATEDVAQIFNGGRVYEVAVGGSLPSKATLSDIRALPIDTPSGRRVALGTVADVRITPTPSDIKRENASRRIDVVANIGGRDLGSVTQDVKHRLAAIHFPTGYHAELLGEAAERQAAQHRLLIYAVGAALAILLLLQAAFRSWRLAFLLFTTLPVALVGGLLAAFGGIGTISLGALIGFYTVLGIAARNGIMMITHFQHLERHEGERFGPELVLRGARERLAPILMTALATALALIPLAIAGDRPGEEIEHPMAIVILGGLVTSTLLNLFVVPALYLRFGRPRALSRRSERRLRALEEALRESGGEALPVPVLPPEREPVER